MKRLSTALLLVTAWAAAHICDQQAAGAEVAYVTDDQRDVLAVLDTATHAVTDTIPVGPGIRACGIALSPDGGTAYVANPTPDTVSVIDLATLTTSSIFLQCPIDGCHPRSVVVSPDGHFLYALSEEFDSESSAHLAITEIDAHAHVVTRTFRVNTDGVSNGCRIGAVSADGRLLYVRVVSQSGSPVHPLALSVIDTATGSELTRLTSPPFLAVVSLPAGNMLAASTPGGLVIIDAATQMIEREIPIDGDGGAVAVSPDGLTAYVLGSCVVFVVDLAEGIVRATIPLGSGCSLWDLAITPDGALLLIAELADPSIIEIDTATNTRTKTLALTEEGGSLVVAPDNRTLYVVNGVPDLGFSNRFSDRVGGLLRVDVRNDVVRRFFPPAGPSAVAATSEGDQLYVANSLHDEVVVIDAGRKRVRARIPVASPSSFAVDPTGRRVFVGSSGADTGAVAVIDRQTASVADSVALDGPVAALAISLDGSRLYAAAGSGETTPIAVIDTETLTPIAVIPADTTLRALAFARDGGALYAAEWRYGFNEVTGGVALIDPAAGRFQSVVETGGGVSGLAVSPDGQTIYAPTSFCCFDSHPAELSVIDAASQTLRTTAPIGNAFAGRIAITSAGDAVYVTSGPSRGQVTVIDTSALAATAIVNVGVSLSDVAIAPKPDDPICIGDCDGDGVVMIAELITQVNIALNGDSADNSSCPAMSEWCNGPVISPVSCLVEAVNNALSGCRG